MSEAVDAVQAPPDADRPACRVCGKKRLSIGRKGVCKHCVKHFKVRGEKFQAEKQAAEIKRRCRDVALCSSIVCHALCLPPHLQRIKGPYSNANSPCSYEPDQEHF